MGAYSFLNVQASIVGPGGAFPLGSGAGAAEEGITVTMLDDKGDTKVGADGTIMQSLRASNLGQITVRLLKTSPINALLSTMYNFQKSSSAQWGQNVISITDTVRGDLVTSDSMSFTKLPDLQFSKDGNTNEWVFRGNVNEILGSG